MLCIIKAFHNIGEGIGCFDKKNSTPKEFFFHHKFMSSELTISADLLYFQSCIDCPNSDKSSNHVGRWYYNMYLIWWNYLQMYHNLLRSPVYLVVSPSQPFTNYFYFLAHIFTSQPFTFTRKPWHLEWFRYLF